MGPFVRGFAGPYREYSAGPRNFMILRAPMKRGVPSRIEFHEPIGQTAKNAFDSLTSSIIFLNNGANGDKAESGKNAGEIEMTRGETSTASGNYQPSPVTMQLAVRVPPFAEGMSLDRDWEGTSYLYVSFAGGSEAFAPIVRRLGYALDDAFYMMRIPVIRAFPPGVKTNVLEVKVLGMVVKRRCIFTKPKSICPQETNPPASTTQQGASETQGKQAGGFAALVVMALQAALGRRRVLLWSDQSRRLAAPEWMAQAVIGQANAGNDGQWEGINGDQQQLDAIASGAHQGWRVTVLPPLEGRRAFDAHPEAVGGAHASSYSRHAWTTDAAGSALAQRSLSIYTDCNQSSSAGSLCDRMPYDLTYSHPHEESGRRLQKGMDDPAGMNKMGCLGMVVPIYEQSFGGGPQVVFSWGGIITVTLDIKALASVGLYIGGRLCIDRREIAATLYPAGLAVVEAQLTGEFFFFLRLGLILRAPVLGIAVVPRVILGLNTGGGLRLAFEMDLVVGGSGISLKFYYSLRLCFGWQRICFSFFCISVPFIVFCSPRYITLFDFKLPDVYIPLVRVSTGPYDLSPPNIGDITLTENDERTIVLTLANWKDSDSGISSYSICMGTWYGGCDLVPMQDIGTSTTFVFKNDALAWLPDGLRIWAKVRAFNGDDGSSESIGEPLIWDRTPPVVVDLRIQPTQDGDGWERETCLTWDDFLNACTLWDYGRLYSNSSRWAARFFIVEPNPQVSIASVDWAVGLCHGCDDTKEWETVGRSSQLENRNPSDPFITTSAETPVTHGRLHFVSVRTLNSAGQTATYSLASLVDLTPPVCNQGINFGGPCQLWDYFLREIDYTFIDTFVMPGWKGWAEDYTPIDYYQIGIADLNYNWMEDPGTVSGAQTSGFFTIQLDHGQKYYTGVAARNRARSWSDFSYSNGFVVDITPPVISWLTLHDPLQPDDGWLLSAAASASNTLVASALAGNTTAINGTVWRRQPSQAVSYNSSIHLPYWDTTYDWESNIDTVGDPFPALTTLFNSAGSGYDVEWANGQQGTLVFLVVRWAVVDPESSSVKAPGGCAIGVGSLRGGSDLLDFTPVNVASAADVAAAPRLTYTQVVTLAAGKPGVYNLRSRAQYFEAIVAMPSSKTRFRTMYATARCTNRAQNEITNTTWFPVLHDPSAPQVSDTPQGLYVRPGAKQGSYNWRYQKNASYFPVSWANALVDPESDIRNVELRLGTRPGSSDVMRPVMMDGSATMWPTAGFPSNASMSLPHNTTVFATLRVLNFASPAGVTTYTAGGVMIDLTPPSMLFVGEGSAAMPGSAWTYRNTTMPRATAGIDCVTASRNASAATGGDLHGEVDVTSIPGSVFGNWIGTDGESGIDTFEMTVIDVATGRQLAPWRIVGPAFSGALVLNSSLVHGQTIKVAARATNRAGDVSTSLASDGMVYDATPPVLTAVNVSTPLTSIPLSSLPYLVSRWPISVNASVTANPLVPFLAEPTYRLAWAYAEDLSPQQPAECWWAIGTTPGDDDSLRWTSIGQFPTSLAASIPVSRLGVSSGSVLFGSVACMNHAGLASIKYASPVVFDVTPPVLAAVLDLATADSAIDSAFIGPDGTSVRASWIGTYDAHSPLTGCTAALGDSTSGRPDSIVSWTPLSAGVTSISVYNVSLPSGPLLRWTVTCVDSCGNNATAPSSGFKYDITPPSSPPNAVRAGYILAVNSQGVASPDQSAPNQVYSSSATDFGCRFAGITDDISGVPVYFAGLASSQALAASGTPDITPLLPTSGVPYALFSGLNLTDGTTVYCSVVAQNGIGLMTTAASAGTLIDLTPPTCDLQPLAFVEAGPVSSALSTAPNASAVLSNITARVGGVKTALIAPGSNTGLNMTAALPIESAYDGIALSFGCEDVQSGVGSASVALGAAVGESQILPWTTMTVAPGGVAVLYLPYSYVRSSLLSSLDGSPVYATLKVMSGAGLTSSFTAGPLRLDSTPPVPISTWTALNGALIVSSPGSALSPLSAVPSFTINDVNLTVAFALADSTSGLGVLEVGIAVLPLRGSGASDWLLGVWPGSGVGRRALGSRSAFGDDTQLETSASQRLRGGSQGRSLADNLTNATASPSRTASRTPTPTASITPSPSPLPPWWVSTMRSVAPNPFFATPSTVRDDVDGRLAMERIAPNLVSFTPVQPMPLSSQPLTYVTRHLPAQIAQLRAAGYPVRLYAVVRAVDAVGIESRFVSSGVTLVAAAPVCGTAPGQSSILPTAATSTRSVAGPNSTSANHTVTTVLYIPPPSLLAYDGSGDVLLEAILRAGDDAAVQSRSGSLTARWSCADDVAGISSTQLDVEMVAGTPNPNATSIAWQGTGVSASVSPRATTGSVAAALQHNTTYRVAITVTNAAGLATTIRTDGVTIDLEPPVFASGAPVFVPAPALSGVWTRTSWLAFTIGQVIDGVSGIANLTYSLGTTPGDDDVIRWRSLPLSGVGPACFARHAGCNATAGRLNQYSGGSTVNVTGLHLAPGGRYFASLKATDGARLVSSVNSQQVIVEMTPPTSGKGSVAGFALPADYQSQPGYPTGVSNATVQVSMSAWADRETGIARTIVVLLASSNSTPPAISSVVAAALLVDGPQALDWPLANASTLPLSSIGTTVDASCAARNSSSAVPVLLAPPMDIAGSGSVSALFPAVVLCNGSFVHAAVVAINSIGMVTSKWLQPRRVALSVLMAGVVADGPLLANRTADLSRASNVTANATSQVVATNPASLQASFRGFTDSSGAVLSYSIGWGFQPGDASLTPGNEFVPLPSGPSASSVPTHASYVEGGVDIADGTRVYATVRVSNPAGAVVEASSSGVLYDSSAPVLSYVGIGSPAARTHLKGLPSINSTGGVWINFACDDVHSDVAAVAISLGSSALHNDNIAREVVRRGADASAGSYFFSGDSISFNGTHAPTGIYAHTTCTNGVGLSSSGVSAPSIFDSTPPAVPEYAASLGVPAVTITATWPQSMPSPAHVPPSDVLYLEVHAVDAESGVARINVCIGTTPGASDLVPCQDVTIGGYGDGDDVVPAFAAAVMFSNSSMTAPSSPFTCGSSGPCIPAAPGSDLLAWQHGAEVHVTATVTNGVGLVYSLASFVTVDVIGPAADGAAVSAVSLSSLTSSATSLMTPFQVQELYAGVAPSDGAVVSVGGDAGALAPRQTSVTVAFAGFAAATNGSPISSYRLAITPATGRTAIATLVVPVSPPSALVEVQGMLSKAVVVDIPLSSNITLLPVPHFVTVAAVSAAGRASPAVNTTIWPVRLPPIMSSVSPPSFVFDMVTAAVSVRYNVSLQGPSWPGIDARAALEVAICGAGSTTGSCTWTVAPDDWSASCVGAPLASCSGYVTAALPSTTIDGGVYTASVRVTDIAGGVATATSSPAVLDTRMPAPGAVMSPSMALAADFVSTPIAWTPWLPRSGHGSIVAYSLAISTLPGAADVLPWSTLNVTAWAGPATGVFSGALGGLVGQAAARLMGSLNASLLYVGIQGMAASGASSTVWSGPLSFDGSPPSVSLDYMSGPTSYALARGVAGVSSAMASPLVLVDPVPDASTGQLTALAQPSTTVTNSFSLTAIGFEDADSGLVQLSLTAGTCATCSDIATMIAPSGGLYGLNSGIAAWHITGLNLPHGTRVFATVTATNGAGASAAFLVPSPLTIDLHPPALLSLVDGIPPDYLSRGLDTNESSGVPPGWPLPYAGASFDTDYWSVTNGIAASWNISDDSGLPLQYSLAVCVAGLKDAWLTASNASSTACPLPWTFIGPGVSWATVMLPAGVALQPGIKYSTWLTATDAAGNDAVFASDGYWLDVTPPFLGNASVYSPAYAPDISSTAMRLSGAVDVDSGLGGVDVCIYAADGQVILPCAGVDLVGLTDQLRTAGTPLSSLLIDQSVLMAADNAAASYVSSQPEGTIPKVIATLHVHNRAGMVASITSNAVTLDPLPPSVGTILQVPGGTAWDALGIQYGVNGSVGSASVSDPVILRPLNINGSLPTTTGLQSFAAPALSDALKQTRWASRNTSSLSFMHHSLSIGDSGVASIEYAIGTACGLDDVVGKFVVEQPGSSIGIAVSGLPLQAGVTYYLQMTVTSGAGLKAVQCSDGLAIDAVAPLPGVVWDGTDAADNDVPPTTTVGITYVTARTMVVKWQGFADELSSVAAYDVAVCEASVTPQVQYSPDDVISAADTAVTQDGCLTPWVPSVTADWAPQGSLADFAARYHTYNATLHVPMLAGITFRMWVRATDSAGNAVAAASPGQVLDMTPPVPPRSAFMQPRREVVGYLSDAGFWGDDWSDSESPVTGYTWSLSLVITDASSTFPSSMQVVVADTSLSMSTNASVGDTIAAQWLNTIASDSAIMQSFANLSRPLTYRCDITASNAAGLSRLVSVYGSWDDTPPLPGTVVFAATDALSASSSASSATSSGSAVGSSTVGTDPSLQAESLVTLASSGVDFISSPPYQVTSHAVAFAWRGAHDPQDSQLSYVYAVGSAPGRDDIVAMTKYAENKASAASSTSADTNNTDESSPLPLDAGTVSASDSFLVRQVTLGGLTLNDGAVMFVTVWAVNRAALNVSFSSRAITVDASPPSFDGMDMSTSGGRKPISDLQPPESAAFPQLNTSEADPAATGLANSSVPITGYGGIGTQPGSYVSLPMTAAGDVDWSGSTTALSFAWPAFSDPQSGVARIEYVLIQLTAQEGAGAAGVNPPSLDAADAASVAAATNRRLAAASRRRSLASRRSRWGDFDAARSLQSNGTSSDAPQFGVGVVDAYHRIDNFNPEGGGAGNGALLNNFNITITGPELHLGRAALGRLTPDTLHYGGTAVTQWKQLDDASSRNVTVSGLSLLPGSAYALVLRVWNGAGRYLQAASDGVIIDSGSPCFGIVRPYAASTRSGDPYLLAMRSSSSDESTAILAQAASDAQAASGASGSSAAEFAPLTYVPYNDQVRLSWLQFADPMAQRPTGVHRKAVCADIGDYPTSTNSSMTSTAADGTKLYALAMSPTSTFAVQVRQIADAPGSGTNNITNSSSGIVSSPSTGANASRPTSVTDIPDGDTDAFAGLFDDGNSTSAGNSTSRRMLSMPARGRSLQSVTSSTSGAGNATVTPLRLLSSALVPSSSPCCMGGVLDPTHTLATSPSSLGQPSDVELRPAQTVRRFASSIGVLSTPFGGSYALSSAAASSDALNGEGINSSDVQVAGLIVMPLHHRDGLRGFVPLCASGNVSRSRSNAPVTPSVSLSGVQSSGAYPIAVAMPPSACVGGGGNGSSIVILEVRPGSSTASSLLSASSLLPEDISIAAGGETIALVASLELNDTELLPFTNASTCAVPFASGLSIYGRSVAVSGCALAADAPKIMTGAVSVCASDEPLPIDDLQLDGSAATALGAHQWSNLSCRLVSMPTDAQVSPSTGLTSVQAAFTVPVNTATFGATVALTDTILATGAPASKGTSQSVGMVVVIAAVPGSDANATSSGSPVIAAIDAGAAVAPMSAWAGFDGSTPWSRTALIEPDAVPAIAASATSPSPTSTASLSGYGSFGSSVAVAGSVIAVGAPMSANGAGRVYLYRMVDSVEEPGVQRPSLVCFVEGGVAGVSHVGASVSLIAALSDGNGGDPGVLAVSIQSVMAPSNDSSASTIVPAALLVAVPDAGSVSASASVRWPRSAVDDAVAAGSGDAGALGPRCDIIGMVAASYTAVPDVEVDLGLSTPSWVAQTVFKLPNGTLVGSANVPQLDIRIAGGSAAGSLLISTPGLATWTWHSNSSNSEGRLWQTALCPRGYVRTRSTSVLGAAVPYTCVPCSTGSASFGVMSGSCSVCPANSSDSCSSDSSASTLTSNLAEGTSTGYNLTDGAVYQATLRAITSSGRWKESLSSPFVPDTSAPLCPQLSCSVIDVRVSGAGNGVGGEVSSSDIDYCPDTTSAGVMAVGINDPESGIQSFLFGLSSRPCDGLLHRQCSVTHLYSGGPNVSDCSPLELDWRQRWADALGYPVSSLGMPGYEVPFDLSDQRTFDLAALVDAGATPSYVWPTGSLSLPAATLVFSCVIAVNKAGLRTAVSSDGWVVDTTPPVLTDLSDGINAGEEWDGQAIGDALFITYTSSDYESGLSALQWAAIDADPTPMLQASSELLGASPAGRENATGARAVVTPYTATPWRRSSEGGFYAAVGLPLPKGRVFYQLLQAVNGAGLASPIKSTNGITVGKSEVVPTPGKSTSVGFDTVASTDGYTSPQAQRESTKATVGSLTLPDGAMPAESGAATLRAGSLSDDEMQSDPGLVHPAQTAPPSRNFAFGNYSFTIKAVDSNGTTQEGYKFAKPVVITLYFDVGGLADRKAGQSSGGGASDWSPQLNFWDTGTQQWINARDTCDESQRFEKTDFDLRIYSVAICHLTQFALFYQQRPVALIAPPASPALALASNDTATLALMPAYAASLLTANASQVPFLYTLGSTSAGVTSALFSAGAADASQPGMLLDATPSFDPDGVQVYGSWSVVDAPSLRVLSQQRDAGIVTQAEVDAARNTLTSTVMVPGSPRGLTSILLSSQLQPGWWTYTCSITDVDGAAADPDTLQLFVNRPPVPLPSRRHYSAVGQAQQGSSAAVAAGSEATSWYASALAAAGPDDVVLDATASYDPDDYVVNGTIVSTAANGTVNATWTITSARGCSNRTGGIGTPYIDSNGAWAGSNGAVVIVRNVGGAVAPVCNVELQLTAVDRFRGSDSVKVGAGGTLVVFSQGTRIAVITDDVAIDSRATYSPWLVSQLAFAWDAQAVNRSWGLGYSGASPSVNGSAGSSDVTVVGMTTMGYYSVAATAYAPDAATASASMSIRRHRAPVASLTVVLPPAPLDWCEPTFQIALDASASFDPDNDAISYTWRWSYSAAAIPATIPDELFVLQAQGPLLVPFAAAYTANGTRPRYLAPAVVITQALAATAASTMAVLSASNITSLSVSFGTPISVNQLVASSRMSAGHHSIRLVVTDAEGATDTASVTFDVGADGLVVVRSPLPAINVTTLAVAVRPSMTAAEFASYCAGNPPAPVPAPDAPDYTAYIIGGSVAGAILIAVGVVMIRSHRKRMRAAKGAVATIKRSQVADSSSLAVASAAVPSSASEPTAPAAATAVASPSDSAVFSPVTAIESPAAARSHPVVDTVIADKPAMGSLFAPSQWSSFKFKAVQQRQEPQLQLVDTSGSGLFASYLNKYPGLNATGPSIGAAGNRRAITPAAAATSPELLQPAQAKVGAPARPAPLKTSLIVPVPRLEPGRLRSAAATSASSGDSVTTGRFHAIEFSPAAPRQAVETITVQSPDGVTAQLTKQGEVAVSSNAVPAPASVRSTSLPRVGRRVATRGGPASDATRSRPKSTAAPDRSNRTDAARPGSTGAAAAVAPGRLHHPAAPGSRPGGSSNPALKHEPSR